MGGGSNKVKYQVKITGIKTGKYNFDLTNPVLIGSTMDGEDHKRPKKDKKDAKGRPKSSKKKIDKTENTFIDQDAFSREVERAHKLVSSRKSNRPLKQAELTKYYAAIEACAKKTPCRKSNQAPDTTALRDHESEAPEDSGPEGSRNHSTGRTKLATSKRKRKDPKNRN